jgi:hypothetical protein
MPAETYKGFIRIKNCYIRRNLLFIRMKAMYTYFARQYAIFIYLQQNPNFTRCA